MNQFSECMSHPRTSVEVFRDGKLNLRYACLRYSIYTVKTLKIGTPRLTTVAVLNIKQYDFTVMPPNDVDRMANSVDPDQTAP